MECSSSILPPEPMSTGSMNLPGVDASILAPVWIEEPWNPYKNLEEKEKRKRLIKLICKVKGHQYNEGKELKDFEINVNDIKLVVKAVANIDLDLKV